VPYATSIICLGILYTWDQDEACTHTVYFEQIAEMSGMLKTAFKDNLPKLNWLDEEMKRALIEKVRISCQSFLGLIVLNITLLALLLYLLYYSTTFIVHRFQMFNIKFDIYILYIEQR